MKPQRLFHPHFTLMIVGQIISLFGNAILRFALSLYVLDASGSAAVFGGILALSMVPTVLFSPIGGVIADRFPRQKIMYGLDFATAGLIICFTLLFARFAGVALIGAMMMVMSVIAACYQPSVQAAIPSLSSDENLMAANGVAVQVQALAMLLGPILGGLLYGSFGIFPILVASAVCFFLSAVMELFLRIPFVPAPRTAAPLRQIGLDLRESVRFLRRDKPTLLHLLLVIAGLNLFLSSFITVGLPFLVKTHLGLSAELYGLAEGALGLGSILGGVLSAVLAKRLNFHSAHRFILATALFLLPIGLALALALPPISAYCILVGCMLAGLVCSTVFSIFAMTSMQQQTPTEMLGKLAAFVSAIAVCAMPLGQAMYGMLFELFSGQIWAVAIFAAISGSVLALLTRRALLRFIFE